MHGDCYSHTPATRACFDFLVVLSSIDLFQAIPQPPVGVPNTMGKVGTPRELALPLPAARWCRASTKQKEHATTS